MLTRLGICGIRPWIDLTQVSSISVIAVASERHARTRRYPYERQGISLGISWMGSSDHSEGI